MNSQPDSFHYVTSKGDKVTGHVLPDGYHRVTFTVEGTDTTCDHCPCPNTCSSHAECVKGTAYVTEKL
jgi:hypothetical protein